MGVVMNPAFETWAKGFGGMDGGNLAGDLWFCGIEWGAEVDKNGHFQIVPFEYSGAGSYLAEGIRVPAILRGQTKADRYDIGIAKVCGQLWMGDTARWRDFLRTEMCARPPAGRMFKMNLYPLNFPNKDDMYWDSRHYEITGFHHKAQYRAWCMCHRFPFLRSLLEKYAPRVMVCTGTTMTSDFRLAFAPMDQLFDPDYFKAESLNLEGIPIEVFRAANGKTRVIVTPFFGYGHMTDHLLELLGKGIGKLHLSSDGEQGE